MRLRLQTVIEHLQDVSMFEVALRQHLPFESRYVVPLLALRVVEHLDANVRAVLRRGSKESTGTPIREWGGIGYRYPTLSPRKNKGILTADNRNWRSGRCWNFYRRAAAILVACANNGEVADLNAITLRKLNIPF